MLVCGQKGLRCDFGYFLLPLGSQQGKSGEFVEILACFPHEERNALRRTED